MFTLVFSLTACVAKPSEPVNPETSATHSETSSEVPSGVLSEESEDSLSQKNESETVSDGAQSAQTEQDRFQNTPAAKSTAPVHHEDTSAQSPQTPEAVEEQNAPSSKPMDSKPNGPASAPSSQPSPQPEQSQSSAPESPISPAPADMAEQVAQLVNKERSKAGLAPLSFDTQLSADALVRAKEIVGAFDHIRPDGSNFSTAVTIRWNTVGENIAWGQSSPQSVMNTWMNSAGHRQNILNSSYSKIGVGVTEENGRLYWVQLFVGE